MKDEPRFQCVACGKLTAGRWPREGGAIGDGSERWPRYHRGADGAPCDGNWLYAEWVEVPAADVRRIRYQPLPQQRALH